MDPADSVLLEYSEELGRGHKSIYLTVAASVLLPPFWQNHGLKKRSLLPLFLLPQFHWLHLPNRSNVLAPGVQDRTQKYTQNTAKFELSLLFNTGISKAK